MWWMRRACVGLPLSVCVLLSVASCGGPGGGEILQLRRSGDSVEVATTRCGPAQQGSTLRLEFVGLTDLVTDHEDGTVGADGWQKAERAAIVILPNTVGDVLGQLGGIDYAEHAAYLEYRTEWGREVPPELGARPVEGSSGTLTEIPLETWEVTVENPTAESLLLARQEIRRRNEPRDSNVCSLDWVPSIDRHVRAWRGRAGTDESFDDTLLSSPMPRTSKVASRFVFDSGRLFTGAFHATNAGLCTIYLGSSKGAVAKSIAHTRPLQADAEVELRFRRLHEPEESYLLVLRPTGDRFEMRLLVRHYPTDRRADSDFVAHYGLRKKAPRVPNLFPLPGICLGFLENWPEDMDPQCSPGDNNFP